ncbi:hypothetical protein PSTT_02891 [Puccinia striiformis]|uniref:Amino acid permease/ SLC12A domain-containing protein n=1 Tax=Puccinia striiformis TaxID=27350 RepID=A0A2S4VYE4_9BASI|nr:hypothetical protein PSTT_02891 [Puccinia striiformis]
MSEIVSAIPTSGGPYFWAAILAKPDKSALAAWITGWFNLVGQVAVTTGISYGCADLISSTAEIIHPDQYTATPGKIIGIYAALLISHGLLNTFGVGLLRLFNHSSIVLHSLGIGSLAIALLVKAQLHQSSQFVFFKFYDGTGGWGERASPAYVAACGILCAHLHSKAFTESNASPPRIMRLILSSCQCNKIYDHRVRCQCSHVRGDEKCSLVSATGSINIGYSICDLWIWNTLAFLFSMQDFEGTLNAPQPVFKILVDVFGGVGAQVAMSLIILCVWHCGLFSVTSNSRMMYAFARDGGLPPKIFGLVDRRFDCPINTGLPILLSVIWDERFRKGPFRLHRFSMPIRIRHAYGSPYYGVLLPPKRYTDHTFRRADSLDRIVLDLLGSSIFHGPMIHDDHKGDVAITLPEGHSTYKNDATPGST